MSKLRDGILGLIVGDAFGVPYEFKPRDTFSVSKEMIGFGTYNQPPGTWSDDSSMTLATLHSIVYKEDIMANFLDWYHDGKFTPYGKTFDVGSRTASALDYFDKNREIMPDFTETALGNGSLMRILPLAFIHCNNDSDSIDIVSSYTHPAAICRNACKIYVSIIRGLILGFSLDEMISRVTFVGEFERLSYISTLTRDDIKSTGYVIDTLEAAIWSILNSKSYEEAIITAVSLGDDTDTVAAVTGGMAGIIYGADSIPKQWILSIARLNDIENLIQKSQDELNF